MSDANRRSWQRQQPHYLPGDVYTHASGVFHIHTGQFSINFYPTHTRPCSQQFPRSLCACLVAAVAASVADARGVWKMLSNFISSPFFPVCPCFCLDGRLLPRSRFQLSLVCYSSKLPRDLTAAHASPAPNFLFPSFLALSLCFPFLFSFNCIWPRASYGDQCGSGLERKMKEKEPASYNHCCCCCCCLTA